MAVFVTENCENDHTIAVSCNVCFFIFQLFMYEAMGLCPVGRGGELIDSAEWIRNENGKACILLLYI